MFYFQLNLRCFPPNILCMFTACSCPKPCPRGFPVTVSIFVSKDKRVTADTGQALRLLGFVYLCCRSNSWAAVAEAVAAAWFKQSEGSRAEQREPKKNRRGSIWWICRDSQLLWVVPIMQHFDLRLFLLLFTNATNMCMWHCEMFHEGSATGWIWLHEFRQILGRIAPS